MFLILSKLASGKDSQIEIGLDDEYVIDCVISDKFFYTQYSINILKAHLKALIATSYKIMANKKEATDAILEVRRKIADVACYIENAGIDKCNKISLLGASLGDNYHSRRYMDLIHSMKCLSEQLNEFEQENIEEVANFPKEKLKIVKTIDDTHDLWDKRIKKAYELAEAIEKIEEQNDFSLIGDVHELIQDFFGDDDGIMEWGDNEDLARFYQNILLKEAQNLGLSYNGLIDQKALHPERLFRLFDFTRHQQMWIDACLVQEVQRGYNESIEKLSMFDPKKLQIVASATKNSDITAIKKQLNLDNNSKYNMDTIILREIWVAYTFYEQFKNKIEKYGISRKKISKEDAYNVPWFYKMLISDVFCNTCFNLIKIEAVEGQPNVEELMSNPIHLTFRYTGQLYNNVNVSYLFLHNSLVNRFNFIKKVFGYDDDDGSNFMLMDDAIKLYNKFVKQLKKDYPLASLSSSYDDFMTGNLNFFNEPMLGADPDWNEEVDSDDEDEDDD